MTYCKQSIIGLIVFLQGLSPLGAQTHNQHYATGQRHTIGPKRETTQSQSQPALPDPVFFPSLAKVADTTLVYLESLKARQEHDLLSRSDVVPLFARLEAIGWKVRDAREIEQRMLPDSDWLVRTLRTSQGTRFMRDMSTFPGGYDRLDRMRQLPHGKQQLYGLINSPGGAELIDYLTNTPQGRRTGAHLSSSGGRGAFNTPTDRLYTKADVYEQIKTSYTAEAARRLQATSAHATPTTNPPSQSAPQLPAESAPAESPAALEDE